MKLHLRDVATKRQSVLFREVLDLTELLQGHPDLLQFSSLEVDLAAQYHSGVVEVSGSMILPLTIACSRCLRSTEQRLHIPFREMFASKSASLNDDDFAEDELEEIHRVEHDSVELRPYIEEAVWLALPYVSLCQDDCKGLCPACGVNRNDAACGCEVVKIDPRLAGLADFFNKNDD